MPYDSYPWHPLVSFKSDPISNCVLALLSANQLKDIVWDVTFMRVHGASRGVRPDDRCLGVFDSLTSGVVRCVTEIDEHADTVHFIDEVVPKRTKIGT